MFGRFRLEDRCEHCGEDRRQNRLCCEQAQATGATARHQRDLQALQLRLPAQIPNSSLLEHVAISNFFQQYVSPEHTFYRLNLDFVTNVIDNAQGRRKLTEIIIALGILILPNRSSSSVVAARTRYTKALRLTNEALAQPDSARTDEALLAVILLGLYETTPDEAHSAASWSAHLDGARMLLRLHGLERLANQPAFQLFITLKMQIVLNCFMRSQPIPPDLLDLCIQLSETKGPSEKAVGRLITLFGRLCDLLSFDNNLGSASPSDIIAQAEVLDNDFEEWPSTLPPDFSYVTNSGGQQINACHDAISIYSSLFSVEVWNLYRSGRISLNGLIVKNCSILERRHPQIPGLRRTTSSSRPQPAFFLKRERHLAVISAMRRDICDSIPFFMGAHENPSRRLIELPLHCRTLIRHVLYFIIQTGSPGDEMGAWAGRLLADMQRDAEVEQGAIWMNRSQTVEGTQTLALMEP